MFQVLKVDLELNDAIYLNTVRVLVKLFCIYAYRLTFVHANKELINKINIATTA